MATAKVTKVQGKGTKPAASTATVSEKVKVVFHTNPSLGLPATQEFASRKRLRKWLRNKNLSIKNFAITVKGNLITISDGYQPKPAGKPSSKALKAQAEQEAVEDAPEAEAILDAEPIQL